MKKTFILQGLTNATTKDHLGNVIRWDFQEVINSIRSWYSEELILSTWNNQNTDFYGIDKVITSEDPGPGPYNGLMPVSQHCNLFRQIVGFKNALRECSGDLVLKIRNDCLVTNDIFQFFDDAKIKKTDYSLFESKIVIGNIMTINPDDQTEPSPLFRVSDWMQLGRKNDLEKYCDIMDLISTNDFSKGILGTEQIWLLSLLKKNNILDIDLSSARYDNLSEYRQVAWNVILDNFKIIDTISTAGIINLGKWRKQPESLNCYLRQEQYEKMLISKIR